MNDTLTSETAASDTTATIDPPKSAFGCIGNRIPLLSGSYLDLVNPKPEQFTLPDIGGALSKICRFGGQIQRPYSVAEHSHHCYKIARDDNQPLAIQLAVLMHDAAEAFIGDCVKPLKVLLPQYMEIEQRLEAVIEQKFGIDFAAAKSVITEIDHAVLIAERRLIFGHDGIKWMGEETARRVSIEIAYWDAPTAEYWWGRTASMLLKFVRKAK